MPVIGFVNAGSREERRDELQGFVRGVGEIGYVEGQSVAIEYRWAQGRIDRLPAMVAELVDRKVSVIAATTTPAALAAQAATTTIPIVFETGSNLIQLGLVVSLNRPGGNLTGVTSLIVEVAPKRLELLHELLPTAKVMGLLVIRPIAIWLKPNVGRTAFARKMAGRNAGLGMLRRGAAARHLHRGPHAHEPLARTGVDGLVGEFDAIGEFGEG
jgi:putative ABC transport system substrate-binding protein